ncbi:hypothetical protein Hanom_Chr04g00333941 [Helianthus anomalus]
MSSIKHTGFTNLICILRNVHDFLMGTGDTVEVIRHSRGDLTQSRLFDTVEVIRHSRGYSTQSR